ncbi:MAG: molybdenum cofactor guanylyltransferase [Thermoplasmata archaeon]|nr:molybdenum cofactor guanylyltransferase [Thermoplasmata archaeon]
MLPHRAQRSGSSQKLIASAVVVAGGDGKRFGGDKLSQLVGEKTILERVVNSLASAGLSEILVVVETEKIVPGSARVVVEEEHSIRAAILTGLRMAAHRRIFLAAGDMPFLNPHTIRWQISLAPSTIPVWKNGFLEPLHSVVGKNLEKFLEDGVKLGEAILASGAESVPAELFPEHEFFNVNTREDLEMARRTLREELRSSSP